jgi:hypothetical protein
MRSSLWTLAFVLPIAACGVVKIETGAASAPTTSAASTAPASRQTSSAATAETATSTAAPAPSRAATSDAEPARQPSPTASEPEESASSATNTSAVGPGNRELQGACDLRGSSGRCREIFDNPKAEAAARAKRQKENEQDIDLCKKTGGTYKPGASCPKGGRLASCDYGGTLLYTYTKAKLESDRKMCTNVGMKFALESGK